MPSCAAGIFAFLASQGAVGAGLRSYEGYTFEQYLAEFGKSYGVAELAQRRATFETNLRTIVGHNQEYAAGRESWYMAVNHLADLSESELTQLRSTKYDPRSSAPVLKLPRGANPESVDWREKGAVTPVKNQGGCGSCWAFSATESVESHLQIATGQLLQLAPQTYVNCVKNPQECGGTGGCEGATMELAFNLTRDQGIALESDMPYAGRDQRCGEYKAAAVATGYVKNPVNEADGLETALATKGPVSVTVAAEPWSFYGGGIFTGCSGGLFSGSGAVLDHGVQAVGYSQAYWLVRNSWGPGWGEKGYIRISRANDAKTFTDKRPADGIACKPYPATQTVGGECGILFDTSYPTGVALGSGQVVV